MKNKKSYFQLNYAKYEINARNFIALVRENQLSACKMTPTRLTFGVRRKKSIFESRKARVRPMNRTLLGHVSLLPRQTILKVRKPEFGTALARCCAENKCWRSEFGPELPAKSIPTLSFQQLHDIGNWSSATFLPMNLGCFGSSFKPHTYREPPIFHTSIMIYYSRWAFSARQPL